MYSSQIELEAPNPYWISVKKSSNIFLSIQIIISFTAILGWVLDIKVFTQIIAGMASMKIGTASMFLYFALLVVLIRWAKNTNSRFLGYFVAIGPIIGILIAINLSEFTSRYYFYGYPEITEANWYERIIRYYSLPSSDSTSFSFVIAGLFIFGVNQRQKIIRIIWNTLFFSGLMISIFGFLSQFLSYMEYSSLGFFRTMSPQTSTLFILLLNSILFLSDEPPFYFEKKSITGGTSRKLLTYLMLFPVVIFASLNYQSDSTGGIKDPIIIYLELLIAVVGILIVVWVSFEWNEIEKERLVKSIEKENERWKLSQIIKNSSQAILLIDENGAIEEYNTEAGLILDWETSEYNGLLDIKKIWLLPDESPVEPSHFFESEHHAEDQNQDLKIETSSGNIRYVTIRLFTVQGKDLRSTARVLMMNDITERVLAEKEIEENFNELSHNLFDKEIQYQTVVNQASDFVALFDAEGRFKDVNGYGLHVLGYDLNEIQGLPISDFFESNFKPIDFERMKGEIIQNELPLDSEFQIINRKGVRQIFDFRIGVINLKNNINYFCVGKDVTERIKNEENTKSMNIRLNRLTSLYESLLNNYPFGSILLFDNNLRYTLAGGRELARAGYNPEHIIGKTIYEIFDPELISRIEGQYQDTFNDKESILEVTFKDQIYKTHSLPVKNDDGVIFAGMVVSNNITNEKIFEEELVKRNKDLETLLYISSHDLKEPIRGIKSFSQILMDRYQDVYDESSKEIYQRMKNAIIRMEDLVENVMILSKAKKSIKPDRSIGARSLVEDAIRINELDIEKKNVQIEIQDKMGEVFVDKVWAIQALSNLISNAIKFTKDILPEVNIDYYEDDWENGFVVRDRGPGVPSLSKERIFKLFQRAVGRDVEGSGAGLAIVLQVAEGHGGRSWVEDRDGGGSNFYITFKK